MGIAFLSGAAGLMALPPFGGFAALRELLVLTTTSDQQIELLITGGVSGSSMVAWSQDYGGSLTAEQIRMIGTYLRSLEAKAPSIPDWRNGAKAGG
jgi:hypothetical protein